MPGFIPSGIHHCDNDGAYSGGSCAARNCTARTIDHSVTTCRGATQDQCDYVCEEGYTPMGEATCAASGSFNGGQCSPNICLEGNRIDNAETLCRGSVGDMCVYICSSGFTPDGAHVCGTDGSFSGGSCNSAPCTGGLTIYNSPTVCSGNAGSTCIYMCQPGFIPVGRHECGMDGIYRGGNCVEEDGCGEHTCDIEGDTDATCVDRDAPQNGYDCDCSAGYYDDAGTCYQVDGCQGNLW